METQGEPGRWPKAEVGKVGMLVRNSQAQLYGLPNLCWSWPFVSWFLEGHLRLLTKTIQPTSSLVERH